MKNEFLIGVLALTLAACNSRRASVAADATVETPPPPPPAPKEPPLQSVPIFGGAATADSLFFSFERTPCFGTCKAYRVEVYRSGFATYNGRSNMEKQGPHTTRIGTQELNALLNAVEQADFFAMQDKYDAEVTDLPSTIIRTVVMGKDKKVIGRVGQPQAFKTLAAKAEELLLPLPWKPVRAEP